MITLDVRPWIRIKVHTRTPWQKYMKSFSNSTMIIISIISGACKETIKLEWQLICKINWWYVRCCWIMKTFVTYIYLKFKERMMTPLFQNVVLLLHLLGNTTFVPCKSLLMSLPKTSKLMWCFTSACVDMRWNLCLTDSVRRDEFFFHFFPFLQCSTVWRKYT